MAKLETLHGVTVNVADEKVERLLATGGYRLPGAKQAKEAEGYAARSKADLVTEIEKRNEGREADAALTKTGNKADLVSALEADDAAARGALDD